MNNSIYHINKGVNQALYFKGLQAQYVSYLAIVLLLLMILSALLFVLSVPAYLTLPAVGCSGLLSLRRLYRLSRTYGQYGLLKVLARRRMPRSLRLHGRSLFMESNKMLTLTNLCHEPITAR